MQQYPLKSVNRYNKFPEQDLESIYLVLWRTRKYEPNLDKLHHILCTKRMQHFSTHGDIIILFLSCWKIKSRPPGCTYPLLVCNACFFLSTTSGNEGLEQPYFFLWQQQDKRNKIKRCFEAHVISGKFSLKEKLEFLGKKKKSTDKPMLQRQWKRIGETG